MFNMKQIKFRCISVQFSKFFIFLVLNDEKLEFFICYFHGAIIGMPYIVGCSGIVSFSKLLLLPCICLYKNLAEIINALKAITPSAMSFLQ